MLRPLPSPTSSVASRRRAPLAVGLLLVLAGTAACGSDDATDSGSSADPAPSSAAASPSETSSAPAEPTSPSEDDESSESSESSDQAIDITIEGDQVAPNGDRVEVALGEPVDFVVTADAPGEIHVHSDPEEEFEYDAGTSTTTLTFDRPGVIEVESHALDKLIVSLQVQ